MDTHIVNSPKMPVSEGFVTSAKEFSDALTLDLTDAQITKALQITLTIRDKWQGTFRSKLRHSNFTLDEAMKLVEDFEQELIYELATQCDLLVSVDVTPVFEGQPIVIEFTGALSSHESAKYGLDHERKEWEVKRSKDKDQSFLGIDQLDV